MCLSFLKDLNVPLNRLTHPNSSTLSKGFGYCCKQSTWTCEQTGRALAAHTPIPGFIPQQHLNSAWCSTPVISRQRQGDKQFKVILGYIVSLRPKWPHETLFQTNKQTNTKILKLLYGICGKADSVGCSKNLKTHTKPKRANRPCVSQSVAHLNIPLLLETELFLQSQSSVGGWSPVKPNRACKSLAQTLIISWIHNIIEFGELVKEQGVGTSWS